MFLKFLRGKTASTAKSTNEKSAPTSNARRLDEKAQQEALVWRRTPYYDNVEPLMQRQWDKLVAPMLEEVNFSVCVDLAAGHGRNTEILRDRASRVYAIDVNQENVDFCTDRFKNCDNVTVIKNDGISLSMLDSQSITYIHCFDAMVHFDSDVIRAYLADFRRILVPGGHGLCHHSNYTANPTGDFRENPGWRSFMSKELFMHYCNKEGLEVVKATVIDWGAKEKFCKDSDCVSLFRSPP